MAWANHSPDEQVQFVVIHFFTIVLNGMPLLRYHLPMFSKLPFSWHWHVVEGLANLNHDTAWSKPLGGSVQSWMHKDGLSVDGTTEYLNQMRDRRVTVYRKPPKQFWDGKLEMVNAPLVNIREPCLLWEIDSDELWTAQQIMDMADLFEMNPERQSAFYRCVFFVGRELVIENEEVYGNHRAQEWKRTWRFQPGDTWSSHEPPRLMRGNLDVGEINPFTQDETKLHGLVFQHFGYVTEPQLRFKEAYYGYSDALNHWRRLQAHRRWPAKLADFFPWVKDGAIVNLCFELGIKPLFAC